LPEHTVAGRTHAAGGAGRAQAFLAPFRVPHPGIRPAVIRRHTAMTDYERVHSFENLYAAHIKARKGKRHKADVIKFEMNLAANLWKIKGCLEDENYAVSGYNRFIIHYLSRYGKRDTDGEPDEPVIRVVLPRSCRPPDEGIYASKALRPLYG
jgi:hypothetical protein